MVAFERPSPGFYERTPEEKWAPFVSFASLPLVDWRNPSLRFVDLTGDGHPDSCARASCSTGGEPEPGPPGGWCRLWPGTER